MKKACVLCNGCPENLMDAARVKVYLKENSWQIVDDERTAELILFNGCALTTDSAFWSLHTIKEIQKRLSDYQRLIVWGCLPKIEPERLGRIYQGPSFSEKELHKLDEIIKAAKPIIEITTNEVCPRYAVNDRRWYYTLKRSLHRGWYENLTKIIHLPATKFRELDIMLTSRSFLYRSCDSSICYIKTATGCLGNCSYCAIRKSRGTIKSKPIDNIMNEFRTGLSRGFREFSLMGTDLGPYGIDLGYNLADLIGKMVEEKGNYKIGLRSVHPLFLKQMIDKLEPVFATGKIWFIGLAVESGSDRILKLMNRGYNVDDFKEGIHRLRKAYPDLFITTQMMVGFPTETEKDFASSMRLLEELKFDKVEVYPFSPRPGTRAAEMEGRIPASVTYSREFRMVTKALSHTVSNRLFKRNHKR